MVNKKRATVEMGHRYNLRRPALSWKRAVAATSLSLFSLYYLSRTFLKSSDTTELHQDANMAPSGFLQASALATSLVALTAAQNQIATPTSAEGWSTTLAGTPTSFRPVFTIPASADVGADLIPNIQDPEAVNAQDVCPGYKASQLQETDGGISAVLTLAGAPCNVYGNDVDVLNFKVEYQSKNRLAVNISPAYLVSL
jgi:alpha-glucosidase